LNDKGKIVFSPDGVTYNGSHDAWEGNWDDLCDALSYSLDTNNGTGFHTLCETPFFATSMDILASASKPASGLIFESRRRDLNPRPTHYECVALPLSYPGADAMIPPHPVERSSAVHDDADTVSGGISQRVPRQDPDS
jgi:hypothetical protein